MTDEEKELQGQLNHMRFAFAALLTASLLGVALAKKKSNHTNHTTEDTRTTATRGEVAIHFIRQDHTFEDYCERAMTEPDSKGKDYWTPGNFFWQLMKEWTKARLPLTFIMGVDHPVKSEL